MDVNRYHAPRYTRYISVSLPLLALLVPALTAVSAAAQTATDQAAKAVVRDHAELVHRTYEQAHDAALRMQHAIERFLDNPTPATLERAKRAWLDARAPYGRTEAFRFYGGPIDGVGPDAGWPEGVEGPEARINAWPLNEAYIDAVKGKPDSGIVQDPSVDITKDRLAGRNQKRDEADVSTGYHAIEFLLWGQDFNDHAPGHRPVSDFIIDNNQNNAQTVERRREYLRVVTDLLIEDLESLVNAWAPNHENNYRAKFVAQPTDKAIGDIMTGLATLAGFELASERIAVPLDSGDQEDEHSCFADNTHNDYIYNIESILLVYTGDTATHTGLGIDTLVAAQDPTLSGKLETQLRETLRTARNIDPPIDQVLASETGSAGRKQMEKMVDQLYTQAELLQAAGEATDVDVIIAGE